jgi:NAD(P)H dehydrogenase (quinone)
MNRRELLTDAGLATAAVTLFAAGEAQAQAPGTVNVLIAYHSVTGNTEKMAQGVAEGAKGVSSTNVVLKRVGEVTADDLLTADAVIVGSPVYFGNVSGDVKTFLDNWLLKFAVFPGKMRNKVGGAFATGTAISNGKETTMLAISQAMVINQMIVVSAGGAFGAFGASATTGPDSPGIDEKELATASALGKRVAEVAGSIKGGKGK